MQRVLLSLLIWRPELGNEHSADQSWEWMTSSYSLFPETRSINVHVGPLA